MVLFFTLPPWDVAYPYILINNQHPEYGLRYLKTYNHIKDVKKIIIDSGIVIFMNPQVKDYPGGYKEQTRRQVYLYKRIKSLVPHADVYVVIHDYCDGYHPKALWLNERITNIERTIESIMYATEKYPNIPWIIPIQGHYKRPRSVLKSIMYIKEYGILDKYDYYAVANLCVEQKVDIISMTIKYAYYMLGKDKKIHVFGMKIKALKYIKDMIYSFDSMGWTKPVEKELHKRYPHSCKTSEQRKIFFLTYLRHLKEKYGVQIE